MIPLVGTGISLLVWWAVSPPRLPSHNNDTSPVAAIRPAAKAVYSPLIRVNITPQSVRQLKIAIDGPYRVHPVGSKQILGQGQRLKETTAKPTSSGFRIGKNEYRVSQLEIEPVDSPSIWAGTRQYRGSLRLFRRPRHKLMAVNVLGLEEYVASVVDGEMPARFPDPARQAQATVARTYALYQMGEARSHPFFDVHASTRSQKYLGYQYHDKTGRLLAGETDDGRRIARQTAGLVCTYRGELFCTYYSAVCGGRTTPGKHLFSDAAAPLKSVPCQWCKMARLYRWERTLKKSEAARWLKRHFRLKGRPFGSLESIKPGRLSPIGFPEVFEVTDGRRRYGITAVDLRRRLPRSLLPSPRFRVNDKNGILTFQGCGHGHGAGLCQWGANGLARSGKTCLEILQYYYPGCEVVCLTPPSR